MSIKGTRSSKSTGMNGVQKKYGSDCSAEEYEFHASAEEDGIKWIEMSTR